MAGQKKRKSVMIQRSFLWGLLLAAFALGIFVDRGFMLITGSPPEEPEVRPGMSAGQQAGRERDTVRSAVTKYVERMLASKEASAVSLYFLDLKTGNGFGIREDEEFSPQVLLKLPVMMAYFKQAETDPGTLRKKLAYAGPAGSPAPPLVMPLKTLEPGASYTIQDLIYRMLVYGDDEALRLLSASLPEGSLDRLYQALSLPYDPGSDDEPFSLKDYAVFFRALYNGSYLNKQMTSKALNYLSQSSFRNGLVAGIPPNVRIASRFSVQPLPDNEGAGRNALLLREIGIVYAAGHPFLLGVTAQGEDLKKLSRVVRDISSFVYNKEVEQ